MSAMSRYPVVATMLAASLALAGCQTPPTNEQSGMVVGGVLGGLLGSQVGHGSGRTAATIIGALAGAMVGSAVGRSMDETDRMKTATALETVRTGVPAYWTNPDTGAQYTVTPTRTIESNEGPCREYTIDAYIGGKKEKVYGTACRQADGNWKVVQ
nr:RT0821/Lpp0805 family surface protein [uncultured Caldimonas sp.]